MSPLLLAYFVRGELVEFVDGAGEVGYDAGGEAGFEDVEESAEVPELLVAAAVESLPDEGADFAVVVEDGAGVVELVGGGDEEGVEFFEVEAVDVGLFSGFPGGFVVAVFGEGVGEAVDEAGDGGAEGGLDVVEAGEAAVVFDGVVE